MVRARDVAAKINQGLESLDFDVNRGVIVGKDLFVHPTHAA